ncbi:hypothetical protein ZIOFF_019069 [Zingiber officinale]|uniref:dUTPase-like domain-containing protein n=1 Tax=Zingiber officinale TaxID=94328 RepID=A0A8J5HDS3_ZINOF|nr:hypothetical protein ZIOFF_019069 [Zingiber officinale]
MMFIIESMYTDRRRPYLLITRGLVGRLSNTPNVGFAYTIQGVVDYLTSHGVRALPGRRYSTSTLQGLNWVIQPTQLAIPMQPSEVNNNNLIDGRISLSFSNYRAALAAKLPYYNNQDEEVQSDEDGSQAPEIATVLTKGKAIWDTLREPSGKFDYYARHIQQGERIAQLIIEQILMPDVHEEIELSQTTRGSGAFGSTDETTLYFTELKEEESSSYFSRLQPTLQSSGDLVYPSQQNPIVCDNCPEADKEEFSSPFFFEEGTISLPTFNVITTGYETEI